MNSANWRAVALIYLYGVLAVASLSKVIPLSADMQAALPASPQAFGLHVALMMVPAALLAAIVGGVIDRVGARRALVFSAACGLVINLLYLLAHSLVAFQVLRVLEGFGSVGVFAAAPALIMATTPEAHRTRAMAFWSTYTPVGISLGLCIAGPFAGGEWWKGAYALHAALFALAVVLGFRLPQPAPGVRVLDSRSAGRRVLDLLNTYRQVGPLRLALSFGAIAFVGFGTNTVFPAHFSHGHGLSVGAAANTLAVANLAMIAGSLGTGALLSRGIGVRPLFGLLCVLAVAASAGVFSPLLPLAGGVAALCLWLLCCGGATAIALTSLPRVVADPRQGAAAAGLLGQVSSIVTFLTPPVWLAVMAAGPWPALVGLAAAGWIGSLLLLPVRRPSALLPASAAAAGPSHP